MTGQTTAGAHPAGTVPASDRITRDAASARALRACAIVAGPLFAVAGLVQALTRPGFNLTRNALSLLDDGSLGWIEAANFIVTGLLLIAASAGLRRAITAVNRAAVGHPGCSPSPERASSGAGFSIPTPAAGSRLALRPAPAPSPAGTVCCTR